MKPLRWIIQDFEVIRPRFESPQARTFEWLAEAYYRANPQLGHSRDKLLKMIQRFGCPESAIAYRGYSCDDYSHERWEEMKLFKSEEGQLLNPSVLERTNAYMSVAQPVLERFFAEIQSPPQELLHVTCTGYLSPSAAQQLVETKGWQKATRVTHLYHMGCYAAFPALRTAAAYLCLPPALRMPAEAEPTRVDVVHTEICTLQLNPRELTPEQFVVQSLFADGFIKYSVRTHEDIKEGRHIQASGLEILALQEEIVPESAQDMTWSSGDSGLQMTLSREVPQKIAGRLKAFDQKLRDAAQLSRRDNLYYAIHPGGPKIIDRVAELLELNEAQISSSRKILRQYGNMSSATLPHVWKDMLENPQIPSGAPIVAFAFGPGLTICGAVLRKV